MSVRLRPGIYSSYEVADGISAADSGKVIGIAAQASGNQSTVVSIYDYADACTTFGKSSNMAKLIRIMLLNGASVIKAVKVSNNNYAAAFALLMAEQDVKIMVCDSRDASVHAALSSAISGAGERFKYRTGIVEADGTAAQLTAKAAAINYERMVLCGNCCAADAAGSMAAALAGLAAAKSDPALPFNYATLGGVGTLKNSYTDAETESLIAGGVTPIETYLGKAEIVRAVTTKTTSSGVADTRFRDYCTILSADDVMLAVKTALKLKFANSKNTATTRGAVRSLVVVELEKKLKDEIISSYGNVSAAVDSSDASVCNVNFNFSVAGGLNTVELLACVTV